MNSSALGSRSLSRNGEGSMALNNCFNSPTCTSMTEHLGGIGSPAEAFSLVPEAFVVKLAPQSPTTVTAHQYDHPTHYRQHSASSRSFPLPSNLLLPELFTTISASKSAP